MVLHSYYGIHWYWHFVVSSSSVMKTQDYQTWWLLIHIFSDETLLVSSWLEFSSCEYQRKNKETKLLNYFEFSKNDKAIYQEQEVLP